jgi:hypothetical protein
MTMSEEQNPPTASRNETEAKADKAAYSAPVFRVYGSVSNLTLGGGGSLGDATVKDMAPSDPALKENTVRIGTHPLGFGLYLFDYKQEYRGRWGTGRQFGVMADEVESVLPQAVTVHADGYKVVDHTMLGISRRHQ